MLMACYILDPDKKIQLCTYLPYILFFLKKIIKYFGQTTIMQNNYISTYYNNDMKIVSVSRIPSKEGQDLLVII